MPVSLEQWRASVGLNNAGRSRVLSKLSGKRLPQDLLTLFLLNLYAGGFVLTASEGECLYVDHTEETSQLLYQPEGVAKCKFGKTIHKEGGSVAMSKYFQDNDDPTSVW